MRLPPHSKPRIRYTSRQHHQQRGAPIGAALPEGREVCLVPQRKMALRALASACCRGGGAGVMQPGVPPPMPAAGGAKKRAFLCGVNYM